MDENEIQRKIAAQLTAALEQSREMQAGAEVRATLSGTGYSADRDVKATVDNNGLLVDIAIDDEAMEASTEELRTAILQAINLAVNDLKQRALGAGLKSASQAPDFPDDGTLDQVDEAFMKDSDIWQ